MSNVTVAIQVTGIEEDVMSFVQLCRVISMLGVQGHSADIVVSVDGDGSGKLRFDQILGYDAASKTMVSEEIQPAKYEEIRTPFVLRSHIKVSIGE